MTSSATATAAAPARAPIAWWTLALLAMVLPTLIAAHDPPSVTFYNQILAVFGWGLLIAAWGLLPTPQAHGRSAMARTALEAVLAISAIEALGSVIWGHLPLGLGLMGASMSVSAMAALHTGWACGLSDKRHAVLDVFFAALTAAGVVGMGIGLVQAFAPSLADGTFIASSGMAGRAVSNLRQPNHFSTLLVWSCCGAAWLVARRKLPWLLGAALITLFIFGVVLTASRTGMLAMGFLMAWGWLDKRLPRALRLTLMAAPLLYGLCWGGMWLWSHADSSVVFAADTRLHDKSDISSSRFKIWANVLELIRQQPWTGVGYGEFNVAWTLTSFPTRPVAFFDHTHNVLLQWAVEFGVPLALLLTALSAWGFGCLLKGPTQEMDVDAAGTPGSAGAVGPAAVMVALAGLHSLLEYPLWYSYFLLPTAFVWGAGLAARTPRREVIPPTPQQGPDTARVAAGLIMAVMSVWCAFDYLAASNIYAPRPGAGPLGARIAFAMRQPWWGYQADYADVTGVDDEDPSKPPQAFARTLHNLLDARLMSSYARSLAEHGDVDKARAVVQRLKEFHNPLGDEFLAVCKTQLEPDEELPFQCSPPKGTYSWRELLPSDKPLPPAQP